jgi:putative methyltransferase (TIGR04325 family)
MTEPQSTNLRRFKRVARAVLPPVLPSAYRRVRARIRGAGPAEWEYLPDGWPEESRSVRGWNSQSVLDAQLAAWDDFLAAQQSTAPVGFSRGPYGASTFNDAHHNTIMSFAYALARAAGGRTRLSMLDWGGGVGAYYVYASTLLPDLDLDYHCRELPLLAEGGRRLLPEATFYADEETALARHYDFVMASSSIHYSRDWRATLKQLAAVTDGYMYVTRLPVVDDAPSYVVLQRPYRYGYQTEYPGWFLNRDEFLDAATDLGLTLLKEFLIAERPCVRNAPGAADYRGFLFSATGR